MTDLNKKMKISLLKLLKWNLNLVLYLIREHLDCFMIEFSFIPLIYIRIETHSNTISSVLNISHCRIFTIFPENISLKKEFG